MEKFSHKFKELRRHLRLTQVEFAEKLEITQANVSQLENGGCLPTGMTFSRLYQLYPHLDFNWLIKGITGHPFKKQENYDLKVSRGGEEDVVEGDQKTLFH